VAAIVLDNTAGSSIRNSPMFAMSGDGKNDVKIPLAFLFQQDAFQLLQALALDPSLKITLSDASPEESEFNFCSTFL
jgi:mannosidase alpha-like ER degradation enhancer 3